MWRERDASNARKETILCPGRIAAGRRVSLHGLRGLHGRPHLLVTKKWSYHSHRLHRQLQAQVTDSMSDDDVGAELQVVEEESEEETSGEGDFVDEQHR